MKLSFNFSPLFVLPSLALASWCFAATAIAPLWSVTDVVSAPESVYYDETLDTIYVSSIAGGGVEKDGNSWISKLDSSGNVIEVKWGPQLNAPKGMRSADGVLWVADIDELVAIDQNTGKLHQDKITVPGARFLNDVAIGPEGEVYVSDTTGEKIYVLRKGAKNVEVFVKGPKYEAPNGLLVLGNELIVAGWGTEITPEFAVKDTGRIYSLDLGVKNPEPKFITEERLGNLDGIEQMADGSLVVSDWVSGAVHAVDSDGKKRLLLQLPKGAADIGLIKSDGTIIVPLMSNDRVEAFQVK